MQETLVRFLGQEDPLEKGKATHSSILGLLLWLSKNLSAMWETWVRSLGWKNPLEKGKSTHSSVLAQRISMKQKETHKHSEQTWLSRGRRLVVFPCVYAPHLFFFFN